MFTVCYLEVFPDILLSDIPTHWKSLAVFYCVLKLRFLKVNTERKFYMRSRTALPVIGFELFIWGRGITFVIN